MLGSQFHFSNPDVPVIENLDVESLEGGQLYKFWFKAAENNVGQPYQVPVMVAKGGLPGKKLMLIGGVHGDELNPIGVIHKLFRELKSIDLNQFAGSIVGIPVAAIPAILFENRNMLSLQDGLHTENFNRAFPGEEMTDSFAKFYAYRLWNFIMKNNAEMVIDMHTQSRGTDYPHLVFVNYLMQVARELGELLQADIILRDDKGQPGTVEWAFNQVGIPAVTYEIGTPGVFNQKQIARALHVIRNILAHYGFHPDFQFKKLDVLTQIFDTSVTVRASNGGLVEVHVDLLQTVKKGDLLATQVDLFGETRTEYRAPCDGVVSSISTTPLRGHGSTVVRIVRQKQ